MRRSFWHYCKIVTAVHVLVIVMLTSWAWVKGLLSKPDEIVLPIEFVVDVTPSAEAVAADEVAPPEPAADRAPESIPEESALPRRREIEVSKRRVIRRTGASRAETPTLTREEIEKLLAQGARAGDHTSIPDEDQRCLLRVRDVLYAVWVQPSPEAAGEREALLRIRLGTRGKLTGGELVTRSGSPDLDESVERILSQVSEIPGLTPGFVSRHPEITVSFMIDR